MSTERYSRDGLSIATYAGPAEHNSPHSNSRMMVQIETRQPSYAASVGLTMDHWINLVCFIRELDRQGIGITNAPEIGGLRLCDQCCEGAAVCTCPCHRPGEGP